MASFNPLFFTSANKKKRIQKAWVDHMSHDIVILNECFGEEFYRYIARDAKDVQTVINDTIDSFDFESIKDIDPNIVVLYKRAQPSVDHVKQCLKDSLSQDTMNKFKSYVQLQSFSATKQHNFNVREPKLVSVHATNKAEFILPQTHRKLLTGDLKKKLSTDEYALCELIMANVVIQVAQDFFVKLIEKKEWNKLSTSDMQDQLKKMLSERCSKNNIDVKKVKTRMVGREEVNIFDAEKQEDPTVNYIMNIVTTILVAFLLYRMFGPK
jgi:hypothetical protein